MTNSDDKKPEWMENQENKQFLDFSQRNMEKNSKKLENDKKGSNDDKKRPEWIKIKT
jgi:hypothetical protein